MSWAIARMVALTDGRDAARLYVLLVIPMLLALNLVFVPFHAPDDYDHLKRAYALEHGMLWPVNEPGKLSGGYIDSELARVISEQRDVVIYWPRSGRVSPESISDTAVADKLNAHWSGTQTFSESGAAIYLPILYIPQTAALWLGETFNLTIYQSVFFARIANGLAAVSIIACALSRLSFATATILLVLLLPKTLLQFASNSADPIIHALTLAILAFCAKALMTDSLPRTWHYVLVAVGILAIAGVRPPLALMAALPFWIAVRDRNAIGAAAIAVAVLGAAIWFVAVMPTGGDPRCGPGGTFTEKASGFLRNGPMLVLQSLWTHGNYYFTSFVGELGWGNGPAGQTDRLPLWIYVAAVPMFLIAFAFDMGSATRPSRAFRIGLLVSAATITGAVFFAMYVACTSPDSTAIGGVQGRYFVTPLLLAIPAFSGLLPRRGPFDQLFPVALFLFSLIGFATLISEGLRIYWAST